MLSIKIPFPFSNCEENYPLAYFPFKILLSHHKYPINLFNNSFGPYSTSISWGYYISLTFVQSAINSQINQPLHRVMHLRIQCRKNQKVEGRESCQNFSEQPETVSNLKNHHCRRDKYSVAHSRNSKPCATMKMKKLQLHAATRMSFRYITLNEKSYGKKYTLYIYFKKWHNKAINFRQVNLNGKRTKKSKEIMNYKCQDAVDF